MKMRLFLLAAAFPGGPVATTAAIAAPRYTAPEGFRLDGDGTLIHAKSGTRFPLVVDGFARTSQTAYGPGDKNISVVYGYQAGGQPVEVRIGLVHVLMMSAHEHFAGLAPVVGTYFQSLRFAKVRPVGDGALEVPGRKPDQAWQGRFRGLRNGKPYLLSLTTVDYGYWSARVTAAYPERGGADAQARITKLIGTIDATGPGAK